jgi:hypothetical protein
MDFTIDPSIPPIAGDFAQDVSENTQESIAGTDTITTTTAGNEQTDGGPAEVTGDAIADAMDTSGDDAKFKEETIVPKRPKFVEYVRFFLNFLTFVGIIILRLSR